MQQENLTKAEIVEQVCVRLNSDRKQTKEIVNAFFNQLIEILQTEETVTLSGFGKFYKAQTAQRIGRNPKTGEPYPIKPRVAIKFTPSTKLVEAVNQAVCRES